ncbi:MAG: hypothetical protein C0626_05000 [Arcobacter sp.]|nr:MAG: hypothetical protein C0626_05000 [Arcobacter sp.]
MKYDLNNLTEDELTELAFGYPKLSTEAKKATDDEEKRRKTLAKIDKTYLDYPYVSVQTGEIISYPYKGWSKEEIGEAINNTDKMF